MRSRITLVASVVGALIVAGLIYAGIATGSWFGSILVALTLVGMGILCWAIVWASNGTVDNAGKIIIPRPMNDQLRKEFKK